MSAPRLGHVELFTRRPQELRRFWCTGLGAELSAEQPGGFTWLRMPGLELLLRPGDPPPPPDRYHDAGWALVCYTADLPAALRRLLELGYPPAGEDGAGCPLLQDPDGRWVQLVDPDDHGTDPAEENRE